MDVSLSISEILVALMTLVAASFGFIIREQKEKLKTIQNQLSDKKYALYNDIFIIFFDLIKGQKQMKDADVDALGVKFIDIKKDLFIYAPDSVVQKFIEWGRFVVNKPTDIKHVVIYLELFVLIRKDMGNPKTKISENDILRAVMSGDDELFKMQEMIGFKRKA